MVKMVWGKKAVRRDGVGGNEQWEDNQAFDVTDKWKSDRKIGERSQSLIYAPGFVPPLKAHRYLLFIVQVMQPSIKAPIKFNEVGTLALAFSFIVCILYYCLTAPRVWMFVLFWSRSIGNFSHKERI